jgi:pimeloyl-ACP methyl ester carboxylesterase
MIEIAQADLEELHQRIAATRWPDQLPGAGWAYGVEKDYLIDLADYWRTGFDWRAQETRLNELPQFITTIDGQRLHYLHLRSANPDAMPLLLTHGWPSTVADFLPILGPLSEDFHIVAPSVPGFAFSGPTGSPGWGLTRIASAFDALMRELGYDRYGAQGGDFGSMLSPALGRLAPDRVIGVHVNALANAAVATDPADLDRLCPEERGVAEQQAMWWRGRSGYATQMSTRPQTIAYALNDSPVGQLAWNLEWFVDYDPTSSAQDPIDRDAILTDVSIFWLTGTAGSAARLYYEAGSEAWGERPRPSPVPTAVANFRGDHALRGLAELSNTIVRWTQYPAGGHFASLQAPDLLVQDIREFFAELK